MFLASKMLEKSSIGSLNINRVFTPRVRERWEMKRKRMKNEKWEKERGDLPGYKERRDEWDLFLGILSPKLDFGWCGVL